MTKFVQEQSAYLNEDPREKDYYPFVYELIRSKNFKSVLDIGCASGDFINLLKIPNIKCYGIDVSNDLITIAKSQNTDKKKQFFCLDILNDKVEIQNPIDLVTCFGTIGTIENFELCIKKIIELKPRLVMFNDLINENGLDIVCGYKRHFNDNFNYAYNIRCFETWKEVVKMYPGYSVDFQPYKMSTNLKKTDDPIRNFHSNVDNEQVQRNGLDLLLRPYNIFIRNEKLET